MTSIRKHVSKAERTSPTQQIERFLAKFTPELVTQAKRILAKMRKRLLNATEIVYDNYNALAFGFGPSERASEAIFSIALFPKWVNLFFLQGVGLSDPGKRLKGSGNVVRHIRLTGDAHLDEPEISSLMDDALIRAKVPLDPGARRKLIVKSVSEKQLPRRPAAKRK